ncbi:MAG: peptidase M3, partial [Alistipes inops]
MTAVSSCGSKEAPAGANPLLSEWDTPYGVPPFDKIKVSDYMPAFREAMKLHREEIKAIAENPEEPDFENTVLAFDNAGEMLTRVEQVFWSVAAADTNPQMQAVQEKVAPMLSEHYDGIMLDEKLFDRIRKVYEGRDAAGLDRLQKRLVEKVYKDFVRSGANLTAEQKAEFKEIN